MSKRLLPSIVSCHYAEAKVYAQISVIDKYFMILRFGYSNIIIIYKNIVDMYIELYCGSFKIIQLQYK